MTRIHISLDGPRHAYVRSAPSWIAWALGASADEYTAMLVDGYWCRRNERDELVRVPRRVAREIEHQQAIAAVRQRMAERLGRA